MGFKDYYDKAKSIQALSDKSAAQIGDEVESAGYHTADIIREERFIPRANFRFPKNFARYGSAEEYYSLALRKIYEDYPYDGSLKERVEWENSCTYLDLHVFDNEYPRTNGYINFSAGEWGDLDDMREGYGLPADVEYIYLKGGPHANPDGMVPYSTQFTGANYYEPIRNRENNLQFDLLSKGATVEFWMKKEAFDLAKTEKEVIFDLWNGNASGSGNYGRFRLELTGASGANCFRATVLSGGHGFEMQSVAASTVTSETVADGVWHHYALTLMSASNGVLSNFYLDGNLNKSSILGTSMDLNEITGALRANIGALISAPASSSAAQYAGKLSASLDEFRYWKTERSGQKIGRHWFTQVGGGTNDDPKPFKETRENVNTNLGVYYKFNEGITGVAATDSVVLDYSGRITNGTWTGYTSASRATGSAIVLSNAATKEFKDPIIYSFHPKVSELATRLQLTGSEYDVNNNAAMFNSIPSWITEEDEEGQRQLKQLIQIMSSYFDTLQLQVQSLSDLKNITYASGSHKPLPFADRLLRSSGFMAPDLFIDADVLEKLADRSEDRLYEKSLADVKNTIYQNIYNNLVYIYKTKGTEKAFRNLIRCFGIDDELVKLNMYGNGIQYEIRDNRRTVSVVDKFVDFNTEDNRGGTVFQFQDPTDTTNTTGFIPANTRLSGGFAQTLEADILFPLKPDEDASFYYNTNTISASLFGVHTAHDSEDFTTWGTSPADTTNFQVYAVRDELASDSVRFVLTGTAGGRVPPLVSDLYEEVYDNTYWNLAVRVKPVSYPQAGQVLGAVASGPINDYIIELHGVQLDAGVVRNEFTLTGEVEGAPVGFITGSKRAFIGAHRTNFTGAMLAPSDVKVNACRYWLDYVDDATLVGHAFDTQNYGSLQPHRYAFPFIPSASFGDILQADTLMFNWEFSQNTGSNASGEFIVADQYSGSAVTAGSRFDWLGNFLGIQFPGKGQGFEASSIKVVDKDHVISSKLQLPENVQSSDMVTALGAQEQQIFTRDSRPVNYFFAFEKSMAQALSVEMINYFATLKDVNNLIGAPVNRYRPEYKGLKLLRQRFFERVGNTEIDFEKFYEFYKWFDSSLTAMLQQLVPASADFAENVRTIIESHMLERSKYQSKFVNVKQQLGDPEGILQPGTVNTQQGTSPDSDPTGTGFYSANAHGRRQIGTSQPINFKNWRFIHAPAPELGESFAPLDKNSLWWKEKAARNTLALVESTPDADPAALKNKQVILEMAKKTDARAQLAPYKFGAEGNSTVGGVGFGINKKLDFVFVATSPFGGLRGGAAKNVMVGFRNEVEELMNTKDVYWPSYKQRLGFQMNPDINRLDRDLHKGDGNMLAPFSIYSSSVTTGQNLQVIENYAPEIEITNLHHDIVHNSDTPLQGPFPEKYVGGRQYRHTELNEGSDNSLYRAEGWKLKFDNVASADSGISATAVDALDTAGVKSANVDSAFSFTIPTSAGGEGGATTIRLSAAQSTAPPVAGAGSSIGIGFSDKTDAQIAALIINAINAVATTNIVFAVSNNGMAGYDSGITAAQGSSDTQITLTMDRTGTGGNLTTALAYTSLGTDIVDVADFTGGANSGGSIPEKFMTPMLAIVPPNYDDALGSEGFNKDIPTAHRLRNVGTKRPLNIQNVKMTTSSVGTSLSGVLAHGPIGNYTKNYEVVQSNAREKNDPFFNDQSFNFALTPETLATRGRFPLQLPGSHISASIYTLQKSIHMLNPGTASYHIGDDGVYTIGGSAASRGMIDSQDCTISLWVSCSAFTINQRDTGWGSSKKQVMLTWGGWGGSTPESSRWVALHSGSIYPILGLHMTTTSGTDFEWRSDESFFTTEGWHHVLVGLQGIHDFPLPQDNVDVYIDGAKVEAANVSTYTSGSGGAMSGSNLDKPGSTFALFDGSNWASAHSFYSASIGDVAFWAGTGSNHASTASWATGLYPTQATPNPLDYVGVLSSSTQQLNCGKTPLVALENARGCVDLLNPTAYDYDYSTNLLSWWKMGGGENDVTGTIYDQVGDHTMVYVGWEPLPYTFAQQSLITASLNTYGGAFIHHTWSAYYENCNGALEYELPNRTGANSNQSIIVNRFSAGGAGFEVQSRGYMDPAHEELSVYNASPYRNRRVLNFGNTGSLGSVLGADLSGTIRVLDQISRPRGLRQVSQLHCGPFGSDAVYGSVVPQTYVTVPSYHKTNRNARSVIKEIQGHAAYFSGSFAASPVYPDEGDGPPSGAVGRDAEVGSPEIYRIPTMWGPTHTYYGNQASLSIWIYLDASSPNWGRQDYHYILSSRGTQQKLYIDSSTNQLHWNIRSYIGNELSASIYDGKLYTSALETDTWNHITLTKMVGYNSQQAFGPVRTATDPEFMKIYVNGSEDWTADQVFIDRSSTYSDVEYDDVKALRLIIGNEAPLSASYPFCGYMSELMIWPERVLTKDDAARVYNGGIVADITDPTMFKNLSEAEARKNLQSLIFATRSYNGLLYPLQAESNPRQEWHRRGAPRNLLVGLDYHYRFHQFAGSQIGGTDPSDGYSDSPTQWDPDDPWNTAGVLNIRDTWVTGAYTTTGDPYLWGGNWADAGSAGMINGNYSIRLNGLVQLQSEVSPRTVERQEVYDNLYVQHPIPRSIQQYSWVTASVHNPWQDQPLNVPPRGTVGKTIEVYDLQKPTCFSPHSLAMLAQQGTTFKGSQNRYYQVGTHKGDQMAADYSLYHTDGCYMAMTGTSDNLLFKNRTPLFSPLNTMIVDPVDTANHILGATVEEGDYVPSAGGLAPTGRLGGPALVPTFYEATPAISNGRGMYFGTRTTGAEYVQIGNIWTWDQMIGTGSANANKMSWTWWMKQMGPAVSAGSLSDGSGSLTYLVQFGDAAATPDAESFRSFFIGLDTGQPIAGTIDPITGVSLTAAGGESYLTVHANTFSTTSGSWVVTNPSGGPTITEGKWYHVVMTYDAGNVGNDPVFYVNGVKYSTSNNGVSCYVRPTGSYNGLTSLQSTLYGAMLAGGRGNRTGWGLRGYLADVAVWNDTLSDDQAAGLYNNGKPVNIKRLLPDNIRAWYMFSRGAGDTDDKVFNRALPTAVSQSEAIYTISGFNANDPIVGTAGGYLVPNDSTSRPGLQTSASLPGIPDLKTFEFDYATSFNTLNLGRNGPYGYPSWKQVRTGEHKLARKLREENKIGVLLPPPTIRGRGGLVEGLKSNDFVDYYEPAVVYDTSKPMEIILEDNTATPDKANNMTMKISYQNNLDYFTNEGLNNRLGLNERISPDEGNPFNAAADYVFDSSLSAVIKYGQKIYPQATNTGKGILRTREAYDISPIWNDVRKYRSKQLPLANSQGFVDPGASIWPLDAPLNLTHSPTTVPAPGGPPGDRIFYPDGGAPGFMFQGGGVMPAGQTAESDQPAGYLGLSAGELQNTYARFGLRATAGASGVTASLAYTMPVRAGLVATGALSPVQGPGCLLGATSWTANESASAPYRPYDDYAKTIQLLGKNMSIIPEFRISDHLETYIEDKGSNFLASINNIFNLTGAAIPDSSDEEFYKIYSTTDFLKYFKSVDGQLANQANNAGKKLERHAIELSCDALVQFLPYKGFYPAERTVELGRILSQSLGDMQQFPISDTYAEAAHLTSAKRILLEPLMAPGILFNSIKSGIACSSLVVLGERDQWLKTEVNSDRVNSSLSASDTLWGDIQESNLDGTGYYYSGQSNQGSWYGTDSRPFATLRLVSSASKDTYNCTVYGQPIPFEAIRDPDAHLSAKSLMSRQQFAGDSSTVYLYDTGLNSASLGDLGSSANITAHLLYEGNSKSPLYKLGIDNFLCETVNFFQQPLKSFVSKPEKEFLSVEKDVYYGLNVNLRRSPRAPYRRYTSAQAYGVFYTREFGMYSRMSAFGPAVQLRGLDPGTTAGKMNDQTSFEPWLPPHYYGFAEANIIFKAPYSGKVDLDTILGNSVVEYRKMSADSAQAGGRKSYLLQGYELGYDVVRPQITSSVDILEKLLVVPPDTNEQQARWLIQPKFETPVLNFYDVPCSASHLPGAATTNQDVPWQHAYGTGINKRPPKIRGMWHQYGKTLSGSEGIHLSINPMPTTFSSSNYGFIDTQPLNKIVGMPTSTKRIGDFVESKKVEEAIICIPFLTVDGNRKFFDVERRSQEYMTQLALLNKYIFPPTFDFLLHKSVNPIAFYAFEFKLELTQKDLMDIWQNCAPAIASNFEKSTATIQVEDLVDAMLDESGNLQWMIFKVKRRAEKDYSVFTRKGLAEGLPIVQPSLDSPYSYNWPYDYFSFVELIKIDETIVYATEGLLPDEDEGRPIMPDLRQFIPAPKDIPAASRPDKEMMDEAKEGIPLRSPRRALRKKEPRNPTESPPTGLRRTTSKTVPREKDRSTGKSKPTRSKPSRAPLKKRQAQKRKNSKAQIRKRAAMKTITRRSKGKKIKK